MRRHWLRGVLLGVSLVLLLAGGVALAQGLSMTVDQACFECWPGPGEPTEDYVAVMTMNWPWPSSDQLCYGLTINGALEGESCFTPGGPGPSDLAQHIPCVPNGAQDLEMPFFDGAVVLVDGIEELYGEWIWYLRNVVTGARAEASLLFAEDCEEAMREEFVPEPGTIMLLGSGLAGLAGYATLRLRTRE